MTKYLKLLDKLIQKANPSFTEYSLRRTVEKIIIEVDDLNFLYDVDASKIDEVMESIPESWEINKRVRQLTI